MGLRGAPTVPHQDDNRIFGSSPVLQGEAGAWVELFRAGRRLDVRRGYVVVQPGQACDSLYYLESGRITVSIGWHDGSEKIIGVVLPGTVFGETFFFRPDLANATIKADRDSVIFCLGRDAVARSMAQNPDLAQSLIMTLTRKTWLLIKQIEDLRFRSVESRVASLLYTLAAGRDGRSLPVVLALTHGAIADLVGAHRVSVNNAMLALQERGLIGLRPRRVVVKDLPALYELGFPSLPPADTAPGLGVAALD